jgi:nicotinamidase-related amidase
VIDLQKGLLGIPTVHPMDDVVQRTAALAAAFRRHRRPVVLVNAAGERIFPKIGETATTREILEMVEGTLG